MFEQLKSKQTNIYKKLKMIFKQLLICMNTNEYEWNNQTSIMKELWTKVQTNKQTRKLTKRKLEEEAIK